MLPRPHWISFKALDHISLRYVWDDTVAIEALTSDAGVVISASMKMSLRARMVLCIGLYEWNVWRFDGLYESPEPLQIAEAAWCATVDPRYLKFYELSRTDWLGPVQGPIWCATAWLQPAISQGYLFPRGLYDAISLLTRMALHVLPNTAEFQSWLDVILDRLVKLFPLVPEDPFDDFFDRNVVQRLGPLIGRNVLNPAEEYVPELGHSMLSEIMQSAIESANPFLSSPDDLDDLGFMGEPYKLDFSR